MRDNKCNAFHPLLERNRKIAQNLWTIFQSQKMSCHLLSEVPFTKNDFSTKKRTIFIDCYGIEEGDFKIAKLLVSISKKGIEKRVLIITSDSDITITTTMLAKWHKTKLELLWAALSNSGKFKFKIFNLSTADLSLSFIVSLLLDGCDYMNKVEDVKIIHIPESGAFKSSELLLSCDKSNLKLVRDKLYNLLTYYGAT
ncbi:MAG: hypothetical protein ACRYGG_20310 [Janthinobacterium lividum]